MMRYRINHTTSYSYSEPASLSQNELYLQPKQTTWQHVEKWQLTISPEPNYLRQREDYFGNTLQLFMIQHPHDKLVIAATSIVDTTTPITPAADTTPGWENVAQRLHQHASITDLQASQYRHASPLTMITPEIENYARLSFPPHHPILLGAIHLMGRIFHEFSYDKNATTIDTPVDRVLTEKKGVCQDFSHLMISCLRSLGLAARYVSGYLETQPPPGKQKLEGADASHAWLSVYIPDTGWVDLDPTNNLIPGKQHITLAWGRDYGDVTPVKGVVMGGGLHTMSVTVDVSPVKANETSS